MAVLRLGPVANRRRIDEAKVRASAELMLAHPGATIQEIADLQHLHRRTVERYRRHPAFEKVVHELSRERYATVLLPKALRAAERILDNPSARADTLVIAILQGAGLLGVQRMDVHHSGVVVTEQTDPLRERIMARIAELREQQEVRALPESHDHAADDLDNAQP